jgi:hypothetical protein
MAMLEAELKRAAADKMKMQHRLQEALDKEGIVKSVLIPRNRVLFEKLIVPQLVKKFPALYETQKFIAVFNRSHHLSLF